MSRKTIHFENELLPRNRLYFCSIHILFSGKFNNPNNHNFNNILSVLRQLSVNITPYISYDFLPVNLESPEQSSHIANISSIVKDNSDRFCLGISDAYIDEDLCNSEMIILSYSLIGRKYYITGLSTLNLDFSENKIFLDTLCGDLFFSNIGSTLLTFIKLFSVKLFNDKAEIYLCSVAHADTQNFYRNQNFKPCLESYSYCPVCPFFGSRKHETANYTWNYSHDNLEDKYKLQTLYFPFEIKLIDKPKSQAKYSSDTDDKLIDIPYQFKPLPRNSPTYYGDPDKKTGGKRKIKTTKSKTVKRKRKTKTIKRKRNVKSSKYNKTRK